MSSLLENGKTVLSLLDNYSQNEDAESRLRKTIWFISGIADQIRNTPKILYFDCFSSADFYQTPGYELIGICRLLCIHGRRCKTRIFRPDVDLHLVRDGARIDGM